MIKHKKYSNFLIINILVVCFVFSAFLKVYAFEEDNIKSATKLNAVGILSGYSDGSLRLENKVTRAEMAVILVKMLGKEEYAKSLETNSKFKDVLNTNWAQKYIDVAARDGIIRGYDGGMFKPDEAVTYAELVTMMVRVLGAGEVIGSFGKWPDNYIDFAKRENLIKDMVFRNNDYATRGDVAYIVDNTMSAKMWTKIENIVGEDVKIVKTKGDSTKTIYNNVLGIDIVKKVIVSKPLGTYFEPNKFVASEKVYYLKENFKSELCIGQELDLWLDRNKDVIYFEKSTESDQKKIIINKIEEIFNNRIVVRDVDNRKRTYKFLESSFISVNGEKKDKSYIRDMKVGKGNIIVNDDYITSINLVSYEDVFLIESIDKNYKTNIVKITVKTIKNGFRKVLTYDMDKLHIVIDNKNSIYDLDKNDVILISKNRKYIRVLERNIEIGKVDYKRKTYIQLNKERFEFSKDYFDSSFIDTVSDGDYVLLYLDENEDIVMFEKMSEDKALPKYGVIVDFKYEKNNYKIELLNLETGEFTNSRILNAKETDEVGMIFVNKDFYDERNKKLRINEELKNSNDMYLGKVVKYIMINGEIILYKPIRSEFFKDEYEDISFNASKNQIKIDSKWRDINKDVVKVYQSLEVKNERLEIEEVEYLQLRNMYDVDLKYINKKNGVQVIYFPLITDKKSDNKKMQILRKVDNKYTGIIENINKVSDDIEVSVRVGKKIIKFYVTEFHAKNITLNREEVVLSNKKYWRNFIGLEISFGKDSNDYVTIENLDF